MTSGNRTRRHPRRVGALVALSVLVAAPAIAEAAQPAPPVEAGLKPVLEEVLDGDLVMAGNSNLLAAGGWLDDAAADVDGEKGLLCIARPLVPATCADNSSSAVLDIPTGGRVVHARLYVQTSLPADVGPVRVRLDGPAAGFSYTQLGTTTSAVPKLVETVAVTGRRSALRQAVWDVTDLVTEGGAGSYTVADIVNARVGAFLPYASWAIVAAYELDPAADLAIVAPTPEARQRFARRAVSWHDGLATGGAAGPVEVTVDGFSVDPATPVFAKSFHVVGHSQHRGAENLLFDGKPIGNSAAPGNGVAPAGVTVGTDPACNSITDVLNDTICHLGTPVATKRPGPTDYTTVEDGRTVSSGSAVDMDVVRIPSSYFRVGATSATLSVLAPGDGVITAGVLAVSVDLPPAPAVVAP